MHNNYYLLSALAEELNEKLTESFLLECFSQNKDELILGFSISPKEDFYIKAHLSNTFSCLSFYEEFARAKRNSVNLFADLIDRKVLNVYVHLNERAISITLDNNETLTLKLFGRFSNVIHFSSFGKVEKIFNNQYDSDLSLKLSDLNRELSQSEFDFIEYGLENCFPTFSKEMKSNVNSWDDILKIILELKEKQFYLKHDEILSLSMIDSNQTVKKFDSAISALTDFFHEYIRVNSLKTEKQKAIKDLKSSIKGTQKYISKNLNKLKELEEGVSYKEIADIIMANLYQIPPHTEEVELLNFYTNELIKIRLKKHLNAQKNAENFYRKQKQFGLQLKKLKSNITIAKTKLEKLELDFDDIQYVNNIKSLRKLLDQKGLSKKVQAKVEEELFKTFEFLDYKIYVGKNSKNNDLLTLKYTHKDDHWLHAKDVPGSHVVVKYKTGKSTPKKVLERAAELAAFYSKRKNDTLCPVTVTLKKYVRKTKGLPAGAVFVEKEEVLLVEPKEK